MKVREITKWHIESLMSYIRDERWKEFDENIRGFASSDAGDIWVVMRAAGVDVLDRCNFIPYRYYQGDEELVICDIKEGTVRINSYAFADCHNLKEVYIPRSVEVIEDRAFFNCIHLERIHYDGTAGELLSKIEGHFNSYLQRAISDSINSGLIRM